MSGHSRRRRANGGAWGIWALAGMGALALWMVGAMAVRALRAILRPLNGVAKGHRATATQSRSISR